jgi:anthranilate synthase component 2
MLTLIDNYDSFTYNLVHYLAELGAEVDVYRNDEISADEVLTKGAKGIVVSPGPCDPDRAGICLELIEKVAQTTVPLLGVCLGHEAIAQSFGGKIIRAPKPMHGKVSEITHDNSGIFANIPSPFSATRYHSLVAEEESLPDCLEVNARTDDGLIMGLKHKILPIYGVQFHPESIATPKGHDLLKNFLEIL